MKNLYCVETKFVNSFLSSNTDYSKFYVCVTDPTKAYDLVLDYLKKNNIGFYKDRELKSITLIANGYENSLKSGFLFLVEGKDNHND